MTVVQYNAITIDGYVATLDNDTSWTSKDDWESFEKFCRRMKTIVMGKRTYKIYLRDDTPFYEDCSYYVLSKEKDLPNDHKNVQIVDWTPEKFLENMEKQGVSEVGLSSGGTLNSSFMKLGLVDEVYLDVEPVVLGQGIPLYSPANFELKLELVEVKNLSAQTVQLHYKVKK